MGINAAAGAVAAITRAIRDMQKSLEGVEKVALKVESTISRAFNAATVGVTGFVTAGLAATVEGERLRLNFQLLSREIAGVFLPTVERLTNALRGAWEWFGKLSVAQQDNLLRWGETAGAVALTTKAMSPVAAVVNGLVPGLGTVLQLTAAATAGILTYTGGIEKLWKIGEPVLAAMESAWDALGNALEPVFNAVGDVASAFAETVATGIVDFLQSALEIVDDLAPAFDWLAEGVRVFGQVATFIFEGLISQLKTFIRLIEKAAVALGYVIDVGMRGVDAANERVERKKAGEDTTYRGSGGDFDDKRGHRAVTPSQVGTEALTASFSRIQEAVLRLGMEDKQDKANAFLAEISQNGKDMNRKLDNLKPGLA